MHDAWLKIIYMLLSVTSKFSQYSDAPFELSKQSLSFIFESKFWQKENNGILWKVRGYKQ